MGCGHTLGVSTSLIFDLDGTLVDSLPGIAASLNRGLTAHGLLGHSHDAVRSFIGDGMRTLIRRALPNGSDRNLLESLARYFKADYEVSWSQGTMAYPGIEHLLVELMNAGRDLAVLSNKPHDFTLAMVRQVFPEIRFTKIMGHQDDVPLKPDPAGALRIASAFGVDPSACLVIGDSTMDIETAINAGMKSLSVAWGYHDVARLVAAGAEQVADSPTSLFDMLVNA